MEEKDTNRRKMEKIIRAKEKSPSPYRERELCVYLILIDSECTGIYGSGIGIVSNSCRDIGSAAVFAFG